jgi:hypothetical protein
LIVRLVYLVLQLLVVPFWLFNMTVCARAAMVMLGVADGTTRSPLVLVAGAIGMGAWALNTLSQKVLARRVPTWIRLLWLPGVLFSVVANLAFSLSMPFEDEFVWSPALLARLSAGELTVAATLAVLAAGSPFALGWLGKWRTDISISR